MAEWLMAAVLKTVVPERVSGVRIPLPPPPRAARSGWREWPPGTSDSLRSPRAGTNPRWGPPDRARRCGWSERVSGVGANPSTCGGALTPRTRERLAGAAAIAAGASWFAWALIEQHHGRRPRALSSRFRRRTRRAGAHAGVDAAADPGRPPNPLRLAVDLAKDAPSLHGCRSMSPVLWALGAGVGFVPHLEIAYNALAAVWLLGTGGSSSPGVDRSESLRSSLAASPRSTRCSDFRADALRVVSAGCAETPARCYLERDARCRANEASPLRCPPSSRARHLQLSREHDALAPRG